LEWFGKEKGEEKLSELIAMLGIQPDRYGRPGP
jgi:hypothetical protein